MTIYLQEDDHNCMTKHTYYHEFDFNKNILKTYSDRCGWYTIKSFETLGLNNICSLFYKLGEKSVELEKIDSIPEHILKLPLKGDLR